MNIRKKKSVIRTASNTAQVYSELPVLPKEIQPIVSEERDRNPTVIQRMPVSVPVVSQGASRISAVPMPLPVNRRYMLEFSDGQRVPVRNRCGAGRMPASPSDGYDAFAVLHDSSQQVSRRHFEFGVTPLGQVWVVDCDSANGTWLEAHGTRIQLTKFLRTGMSFGDVLCFGSMRAKLIEVK